LEIEGVKVAIHQPNFLPWMGLFHRLFLVDVFIFLDHVQAMRGRSWLSRNRLMVGGEKAWFSMPVRKSGRSGQSVAEVEINYNIDFVSKHLKTIKLNYGKAPFFEELFPELSVIFEHRYQFIADFNMAFIQWVCLQLELPVGFMTSSSLVDQNVALKGLAGNDLVLELCKAAGAKEYVSGTGCLDFIHPASFEKADIAFYFQKFIHPTFQQIGATDFISHLSILDALFNVGPEKTRNMVCQLAKERAIKTKDKM
jgi:hypothetical protein